MGVGRRATGLCVRPAALGALGERAFQGGGTENETVGGRVVAGVTGILTGFNTIGL